MGLSEYEGVEFEDEKYIPEATVTEKGGIYAYLLSKGFVKNQTQANIFMLCFAGVIIVLAFFIFKAFTTQPSNAPKLTPEDSYRAGNPAEIDNTLRP